MTQIVRHEFEGKISQFMPGRRSCFVTLSKPIGSVRRAFLNARVLGSFTISLQVGDTVRGILLLGDAAIAEIIAVN